jgi:hypothetical protein
MSFTDEEIAYLQSQPIARVGTLCADGQPDVVPLAFEFDGTFFWVGVPARLLPTPASSATSGPETRRLPWSSTTWCPSIH